MTEIFQSSPHLPSSSSSSSNSTTTTFLSPIHNDVFQHQHTHDENHERFPNLCPVALYRRCIEQQKDEQVCIGLRKKREREEADQLSLFAVFAVLVTGVRKSIIACKKEGRVQGQIGSSGMEIGLPMNVRHVAHVTFDRFNGFLGLPVEFEPEVSRMPPSASTRVFGVSTESMQLSFDYRGNSVPTILLMMQRRLYAQGGMQAEGIFRINAENGEDISVREQLNRGIVPDNVDVHCLAGLIKAWFRELPTGVLDSIPPEQVMQAQFEEECLQITRLLPPTEAALLDWALNLMADVAQLENFNKMNPRNIAMVFAPNMTKMADPLTALMFVVRVMNFLKTLIERILKVRQDSVVEFASAPQPMEPSDQSGDHDALQQITREQQVENEDQVSVAKEEVSSSTSSCPNQEELESYYETHDDILLVEGENTPTTYENPVYTECDERENILVHSNCRKNKYGQLSYSGSKKLSRKDVERQVVHDNYVAEIAEKGQDSNIISRVNWRTQRLEAWR